MQTKIVLNLKDLKHAVVLYISDQGTEVPESFDMKLLPDGVAEEDNVAEVTF
ncbi:MAG: hypothetical protein MN733_12560 [Nitrososphaera sp.]|nr:hypothetical protein [Nitrososphaera sp.]